LRQRKKFRKRFNISQPYRPPRPVKGIALLYFTNTDYRDYGCRYFGCPLAEIMVRAPLNVGEIGELSGHLWIPEMEV
jgi:hypothetical protein